MTPSCAELTCALSWLFEAVTRAWVAVSDCFAAVIASWSAARVAGATGGSAALSSASLWRARVTAVFAWLSVMAFWRRVSVRFWIACASWSFACVTLSFAAAFVAASGPFLSLASRAVAAARFASAASTASWAALSSAAARTWPFVTASPTFTLTLTTGQLVEPAPLPLEPLEEDDALLETRAGSAPKARP